MSVESILKKIGEAEGMGEEDVKELQEALKKVTKTDDSKGIKELREAKAAQSRILEEKKKVQEKYAELEIAMDELKNGGLSEVEKSQKEIDKLNASRETLESQLEELKVTSALTDRNYKLEKISSKLKFLDSVPEDMRSYAIKTAFESVEDLSDTEAVTNVLESFTESHKGVLASETAARGSGSVGDNSRTSDLSTKSPDKMTIEERAKHIREKTAQRRVI